jgi:hypothetical protein
MGDKNNKGRATCGCFGSVAIVGMGAVVGSQMDSEGHAVRGAIFGAAAPAVLIAAAENARRRNHLEEFQKQAALLDQRQQEMEIRRREENRREGRGL